MMTLEEGIPISTILQCNNRIIDGETTAVITVEAVIKVARYRSDNSFLCILEVMLRPKDDFLCIRRLKKTALSFQGTYTGKNRRGNYPVTSRMTCRRTRSRIMTKEMVLSPEDGCLCIL